MSTSTQHNDQIQNRHKKLNVIPFRRTTVAVAAALSVAGAAAVAKPTASLPGSSPPAVEQAELQAPQSFATLVERVQPAVVNVAVTAKSAAMKGREQPGFQAPNDPYFKDFFERFFRHNPTLPHQQGPLPKITGVGSGFIVTADGYVVTNNHVIEGAEEIQVVLNDGERLPAVVRGRDPKTDLALLKIDTDEKLPYVAFGDSDKARPGDWVVAIGNPFGLGGTATTGIISARGRDIQSGPYDDYLQIDAPINRGNSGGPLFDTRGEVIGVNTAIFSPNGGNVGIGFAVPAAQAKTVVQQLMAKGLVERGWLGVQIQKVTDALAESMDLPKTHGALVSSVTPDSPAARAGIEVGDVIMTFDTQDVDEMKALPRLVAATAPGDQVRVTVWRNGKEKTLKVAVERAHDSIAEASAVSSENGEGARLGVALAPMTQEMRQRYNIPGDVNGALVVDIEPGSAAAREGIKPGDVIIQAGGKSVSSPEDVIKVVRDRNEDDKDRVLLLVNRQGDQRFVSVQLG